MLGGSVAQGLADRWSDIDTVVYWDAIDRDWLETPRAAEGGSRFTWLEHYPGNACLEQYRFATVKADVAHVRLGWLDELILTVAPTLLGRGPALADGEFPLRRFRLTGIERFGDDGVRLRYERERVAREANAD